ncbi:hypothetical protein ACEN9D_00725 [Pseudomonas sp. CT11-2]|jgi:hypothetical protein|uniref:hypothetical protein n=1 Tax=unclassified Pseudomonas TaxID=196821 RepID=UPI00215DFD7E|nr:hypothetical protein [Pseudomonas sp. B21-019]UVM31647.1 hypothetical protein LOY36_21015 [Pseudomonas sp. B21-019]
MDVSELYGRDQIEQLIKSRELVEVTGWLVVIDAELYVIEERFPDPYKSGKKIKIANSDIAFSVRDSISPLGGGKSFVFHRVKVIGSFSEGDGAVFEVKALSLEDERSAFIEINLKPEYVELAKNKYPDLMKKTFIDSNDWLDYF